MQKDNEKMSISIIYKFCKYKYENVLDIILLYVKQVQGEFQLGDTGWRLSKSRDKKDWIKTSRAKTLDSYKIRY